MGEAVWRKFVRNVLGLGMMYNSLTKEIEGCEKNSLVYWHEMRHVWHDKIGLISIWSFVLTAIPFVVLLTQDWHWAGFAVGFTIVIELDAWVFAVRRLRRFGGKGE